MLTREEIIKKVIGIVEKDYSWERKIILDNDKNIPKEINHIKVETDKRKNFLVYVPGFVFIDGSYTKGDYINGKEKFLKNFGENEYKKMVDYINKNTKT